MSQIWAFGAREWMMGMRARSDGELVAATPGDPQAFGELYRRHERVVVTFCTGQARPR
jgi:hypothetical protein